MNQEEREALTQQTTQRTVANLQHTTNAEDTICPMLTTYGRGMYTAGVRNMEEWVRRAVTGLPTPILITRTEHEPVSAYHWQTQDLEGDGVTFAYCLEQALLAVLHQQEQQP